MLEELTTRFREGLSNSGDFPNTIKFDFGDDGQIHIDGPSNSVTNEDKSAQCTVSCTLDNFVKMADGQMDPTMAFMNGTLKIGGDMSVAMKLKPLMESARA